MLDWRHICFNRAICSRTEIYLSIYIACVSFLTRIKVVVFRVGAGYEIGRSDAAHTELKRGNT